MLTDLIYNTEEPQGDTSWASRSYYFCMSAEGMELQDLLWKMVC